MRLAVASDHGAVALKAEVLKTLSRLGVEAEDLGTHTEDSVDYPDYARLVAERVGQGKIDGGILMCGTGIGMSIAANKVKGVRAAVVTSEYTARMAKEHNNANIICMGGRTTEAGLAGKMVEIWLKTKFSGERHQRRIDKISALEK